MGIHRVIQESEFCKVRAQNLNQANAGGEAAQLEKVVQCRRVQSLRCGRSKKRLLNHDVYIRLDPVQELPQEVCLNIFSYLKAPALGKCARVSKGWQVLSGDNHLWEGILKDKFGTVPKDVNFRNFFQKFHPTTCDSSDKIVRQLQKFLNKVTLGHNARFRCWYNNGKFFKPNFSVEIKATENKLSSPGDLAEFDIEENCFAQRKIKMELPPYYLQGANSIHPLCRRILDYSNSLGGLECINTFTVPRNGPFQGTLRRPEKTDRFPYLNSEKGFQERIEKLIIKKLEDLSYQHTKAPIRFLDSLMDSALSILGVDAFFKKD